MLSNNVFYHGTIRKVIVAFGTLFSNIYIDRKVGATGISSVSGTTIQRLQIPIAYGPKEKWVVRLEQDPSLQNHTYVSLPRMAFEIDGYQYDNSRKLNKMNKVVCNSGTGTSSTVFAPVPYNLMMSLYVITKNQEDALQIIEQILPTFTPEYTLVINAIPSMYVQQNIPIVLDSIVAEDSYDGAFQTRRFVIHHLRFTAKMNLFGGIQTSKPIFHTQVDIANNINADGTFTDYLAHHYADGATGTYEIVRDQWIEEL